MPVAVVGVVAAAAREFEGAAIVAAERTVCSSATVCMVCAIVERSANRLFRCVVPAEVFVAVLVVVAGGTAAGRGGFSDSCSLVAALCSPALGAVFVAVVNVVLAEGVAATVGRVPVFVATVVLF